MTYGATAPSGTVTDSINFTAVFSDVPDDVWTYTGYRRTGFLEDE
ncbi:lipid-binding protein [Gillisia marina]